MREVKVGELESRKTIVLSRAEKRMFVFLKGEGEIEIHLSFFDQVSTLGLLAQFCPFCELT